VWALLLKPSTQCPHHTYVEGAMWALLYERLRSNDRSCHVCDIFHGQVIKVKHGCLWDPSATALGIIHTYRSRFIPEGVAEASQLSETPTFYQNYLATRNTADVTGGKSIAVSSQSISGVGVVNILAAFYDIHGKNREVLYFRFVPDTTLDFGDNGRSILCMHL
jgi:hypothetical protein